MLPFKKTTPKTFIHQIFTCETFVAKILVFLYINAHILLVSFLDFYRIWAITLAPGASFCHYLTQRRMRRWKKKLIKKPPHSWAQLRASPRDPRIAWTYWSCVQLKFTPLKAGKPLPMEERYVWAVAGGQQPWAAGEPGTGAAQPPWGEQAALAGPMHSTGDAAACAGLPSYDGDFGTDLLYLQL